MKTALRAVTALTALVAPFAQAIDLDVNDSSKKTYLRFYKEFV